MRIQKAKELLEIRDGERIIEVGVGPGVEAEMLLEEIDVNFIGVDLSEEMLGRANDRLKRFCDKRNIKLVQGDGEALSFLLWCSPSYPQSTKDVRRIMPSS